MDDDDKRVSKLYRKILTSNEIKAFMLYENLNSETKVKIKNKMMQNGSAQANQILKQLQ